MRKIGSLCVYCGSASQVDPRYREAAVRLGGMLAARGIALVYGGGRIGLMGLMADACLQAGGQVIGIIPEFLRSREVGHGAVTELVVVDSMHLRKQAMFERSDGFVILPGGLGTLDETFEILTWKQIKLHDKPVLLLNMDDYWTHFLALVDMIVDQGFAKPGVKQFYEVVGSVDDVLGRLNSMRQPQHSDVSGM